MPAHIGPEDVDDDITEVHHDPLRRRETFETERANFLIGKNVLNMVGDGPHLSVGIGGA